MMMTLGWPSLVLIIINHVPVSAPAIRPSQVDLRSVIKAFNNNNNNNNKNNNLLLVIA